MDKPPKPKLKAYLPHVCSLVAIPICYTSVLFLSGLQMLAVSAAALGVFAAFLLCKTIQRRGQVSLAAMIFVLPVLMAGSCAIYLRLKPFVNHQRIIEEFRSAGIGFRARPPDQSGEWLRNRTGTMLPVWLATTIGSDCMSEIRGIDSELEAFQSINYRQLDVSKLIDVKFKQSSNKSHLSNDLVELLNGCPELDAVAFDFSYFSVEDGESLSRLTHKRKHITIRNCESLANLKSLGELRLGASSSLHLMGTELTERIARQLSRVEVTWLRLEFHQLPPTAVSELQGFQGNVSVHCGIASQNSIGSECIVAFAKLGLNSLYLEHIGSVPTASEIELPSFPKTRDLSITNSSISVSDCKRLAALFQCESLYLRGIKSVVSDRDGSIPVLLKDEDLTPDQGPSAEEFDSFWELPNLMHIRLLDGLWNELERPVPKEPK